MKRIEGIIRPERLEFLRTELEAVGYPGIMITEIRGHGKQRGVSHQFRGQEYKEYFLAKIKIEVVVPDADVKKLVDVITRTCRTGTVGDGKIFVSSVDDAVRIRSGESGDSALS